MFLRRSFSAILLLVLFVQTIFLGSGLLGVCAEDASKICHCNHGSNKEKHASKEDQLFKSGKTKQKNANHLVKASETLQKNCHSSKSGEAHMCSCKKKKSSLAGLSIYHQVWISASATFSYNFSLFSQLLQSHYTEIASDGWNWNLIKPPRLPLT